MPLFENFISYRRSETLPEVQNIYHALIGKGFSTFCDIYTLNSGRFDENLLEIIKSCTNFILAPMPICKVKSILPFPCTTLSYAQSFLSCLINIIWLCTLQPTLKMTTKLWPLKPSFERKTIFRLMKSLFSFRKILR